MITRRIMVVGILVLAIFLTSPRAGVVAQTGQPALTTLRVRYEPWLEFVRGGERYVEVSLDPSVAKGTVITSSAELRNSTYEFSPSFPNSERLFLHLVFLGNTTDSLSRPMPDFYVFVTDRRYSAFVPLGAFTAPVGASPINYSNPEWQILAQYLEDPSQVTPERFTAMRTGFAGTGHDQLPVTFLYNSMKSMRARVILACLNRSLENVGARGRDFESSVLLWEWFKKENDHYPFLSKEKYELAVRVRDVWKYLSFPSREVALVTLTSGDSNTMEIVGELFLSYFGTVTAQTGHKTDWINLSPVVSRVIHTVGLSPQLRQKIVLGFLNDVVDTGALDPSDRARLLHVFLEALAQGEEVTISMADPAYQAVISRLLLKALPATNFFLTTPAVFTWRGIDPSALQQLTTAYEKYVRDYLPATQGDAFAAGRLLESLAYPIQEMLRQDIERTLLTLPIEQWSIHQLQEFLYPATIPWSPPIWVSSQDETALTLIRRCATALTTEFHKNRDSGRASWGGTYDHILSRFIHSLKRDGRFQTYAPFLSLLLEQFNPSQPGESPQAFTTRLSRVKELWIRHGIFLYDLKGGVVNVPRYVDVLMDFAKTHPAWVDVVVLTDRERAEATAGVCQFNWEALYTTPYLLAETLLHEGGHAVYEEDDRRVSALHILASHWYRQYQFHPDWYVTSYARRNEDEYIAECTRYWYLRGRASLTDALKRLQRGAPGLLNMYAFLWNFEPSRDVRPGYLPLYELGQDGLLVRQDVPVWWNGTMQAGTFHFRLEPDDYELEYENFYIIGYGINGNRAPKIQAVDGQTLSPGTTCTFTVRATDADALDANQLTYRLASTPSLPAGAILDAVSGVFSWTPTARDAGVWRLSLTAMDASGLPSLPDVMYLTVISAGDKPQQEPPVITPIPAQTTAENQLLTFTVSATDLDGDALTYAVTGLPVEAKVGAQTGLFTWTPTSTQGRTEPYIGTITVSDGIASVTASVTITVTNVNRSPVITQIGDQAIIPGDGTPYFTVAEGALLTLSVVASDPDLEDQGRLTYTFATSSMVPLPALSAEGVFTWTPDFTQETAEGTFKLVVLKVSDPDGSVISRSVKVIVTNTNRPPVITPIPAQTIAENQPLTFTVLATDPDNDPLTYGATILPTGATFNGQTFTWTPTYEQAGTYTVTIKVSDGTATVTSPMAITVTNVNQAPTLTTIGDQAVGSLILTFTATEGQSLTLQVVARDPDADDQPRLVYAVQMGEVVDPAPVMEASTGHLTWTPSFSQGRSEAYYVQIRVTDPGGLSHAKIIRLVVQDVPNAEQPTSTPSPTARLTVSIQASGGLSRSLWQTTGQAVVGRSTNLSGRTLTLGFLAE